jgi:hypothetical protein
MALTEFLILRKPPTGPRLARPEDRLRGCLEGRTTPIQPLARRLPLSLSYPSFPRKRRESGNPGISIACSWVPAFALGYEHMFCWRPSYREPLPLSARLRGEREGPGPAAPGG